MLWCDDIAAKVSGPQVINDSKTPSGRVHVGALRGVLIHDAMFRTLRDSGKPVKFLYGVDDMDPVDEIPAGQGAHFEKYLGVPLCNVPAPPGSSAPDMAEHFIAEFFAVFAELGVKPEIYRMRDIYREGRFDEAIDAILRHGDVVRNVYKEVSNSDRPPDWLPFQVVCENCGRIGTTEVTAYDGREVVYSCRPDLVKWARGCGHRGKVSPFGGRGKLPWKLEWVAKWHALGITIEGAGKDHTTRGGSRDVAAECLRRIFKQQPPLNIPYEFFLVGGAKMSSSRGVGTSARDMADLLPPQLLRFLMLRTQPARPVNFAPDHESIVRLFNEYERYHAKVWTTRDADDDQRRVLALSQVAPDLGGYCPEFEIVLTLVQMPHLDLQAQIQQRKGAPLTDAERQQLAQWVKSARYWLEHFAQESEKLRVFYDALPPEAQALSAPQRAFLHKLAAVLPSTPWTPEGLQSRVFEIARSTPLEQAQAFQAMYLTLLGRASGPKAGNLLAFVQPDFLCKRFVELPYDQGEYYAQTAIASEELETYLREHEKEITEVSRTAVPVGDTVFTDVHIRLRNGRDLLKRIRATV